ncbi:MAG: ATP synthase F1 subunit delta [Clostridia bacterium]|nr:ATP synthase F1 subunit delta [Clostridia bacterium]
MAEETVSKVYSEALFGAARDLGKIEEVKKDFAQFIEILDSNEELRDLYYSPAVNNKSKKELLENIFKDKMEETLLNFLELLCDKRHTTEIYHIARDYEKLYDIELGFVVGEIVSAKALDADKLKKFEEDTGKLLQRKVKLKNKVDESIIGGVKIMVDGRMIDASIKTKLDKMLEKLKEN